MAIALMKSHISYLTPTTCFILQAFALPDSYVLKRAAAQLGELIRMKR
tara:strand:- start:433 stop:576 length:144 start_codon:yes stop_codon:yes gene_type:complete